MTTKKYGRPHRRVRGRYAPIVAAGNASCARCGQPIAPDEPWDLGHNDLGTGYSGPEHRRCNRATAGRGKAEIAAAAASSIGVRRWSRCWCGPTFGHDERCPAPVEECLSNRVAA